MELEEAKSYLETVIKVNNSVIKEARKNGDINTIELTADLDNQSIAIETVLKELENSTPKKKIEKILEKYKKDDENNLIEVKIWDIIDDLQELLEG